jgi:hypothetical protein
MAKTIDVGSDKPAAGYVTGAQLWWLSYMDNDVFRGVVIVQAGNVRQAEERVEELGIRPDGESFGMEVSHIGIAEEYLNRVLTKEECDEATPVTGVAVTDDKLTQLANGGPLVTGHEAAPQYEGAAKRGGLVAIPGKRIIEHAYDASGKKITFGGMVSAELSGGDDAE